MVDPKLCNAAVVQKTITPAFLGKVEGLMAVLQYVAAVCRQLGLPRSTFYVWKETGKQLSHQKPYTELSVREKLLVDFYNAVERGSSDGELLDLTNIQRAGGKNWRAAAWRLERRRPERWGARQRSPRSQRRDQHRELTQRLLNELANDPDHIRDDYDYEVARGEAATNLQPKATHVALATTSASAAAPLEPEGLVPSARAAGPATASPCASSLTGSFALEPPKGATDRSPECSAAEPRVADVRSSQPPQGVTQSRPAGVAGSSSPSPAEATASDAPRPPTGAPAHGLVSPPTNVRRWPAELPPDGYPPWMPRSMLIGSPAYLAHRARRQAAARARSGPG